MYVVRVNSEFYNFCQHNGNIEEFDGDSILESSKPCSRCQQMLSKLPRNSAKTRVRNRCEITGRPHGVYRKLRISRIALRQLGLQGKIPGMIKSSW